ncbi:MULTISPECIES: K+/H+ antiporter subunit F [Ectothiorhodospira]|jgi:multicomponent K+:H+ antiporter subunit F|uniref:Multicomponent K+:H+ antiporter subunit F n=1 Tax=Ectothiorhodospira marina TaxID=1396821 RepID=A0A1H7HK80_9GAMM|nr:MULTISPECIES: K+/H+ antiporter subunit F [Ectothiorhodospira]MCG5515893.1 K+/H+ antiporter subunit F [Ectothiorhodospira sp. 9100]MCG5518767.1 K+/H+ antiporter subunit F [Ectothiorhodospira sp. 9905]SEK50704.1 multicomponent K+:H+ antiporter subunit F [Ectothiorhodospira marina]
MIEYALIFGFFAVSVALLMNLWRLIQGPTVVDRLLAVDTMVINVIALIILQGMYQRTTLYFEAALLLAMFGFVSTVAYCRFLLRGDVIE